MKRMKKMLAMLLVLALALSNMPLNVSATEEDEEITEDVQYVTSVDELESSHPYEDDLDKLWVYTGEDEDGILKVTFDEATELEDGWDYITIYDGDNNSIGSYTGNELSGGVLYIRGNVLKVHMETDGSDTYWGFKVTDIESVETGIMLDRSKITLDAEDTDWIEASVFTTGNEEPGVVWSSSDPAVATVDEEGVVTAVSKGEAVITAELDDGSGLSAFCKVIVKNDLHNVTSVDELESPHYYPSNSSDAWAYRSENECSALKITFDVRTSLADDGEDYILIENENYSYYNEFYGESLSGRQIIVPGNYVKISLYSNGEEEDWGFKVASIEEVDKFIVLDREKLELEDNDLIYLNVSTESGEGEDADVTWTSSNPEVASVREDGAVMGLSKGEAVITATKNDGSGDSASCKVIVRSTVYYVKDISELETEHNYSPDMNHSWYYTAESDCAGMKITFDERTCLDEDEYDYITIYDGEGSYVDEYYGDELAGKEVIVRGNGFRIHMYSDSEVEDWGFKVTDVQELEKVILFEESEIEIEADEEYQLDTTLYAQDEEDVQVTWSSSNPAIATVDQEGLVTGVKKGEVYITADIGDGVNAKCKVVVLNDIIRVTNVSELESEHNYASDENTHWAYESKNECAGLEITFDARTMTTEEDFIRVYNSEGSFDDYYYEDDLAGRKVVVPGNEVRIQLQSYDEETAWGFKVTSIKELDRVICLESVIWVEDGETYELTPDIRVMEGETPGVKWTSSNPEVATVSSNGYVTGVSKGETVVTAELDDGSGVKAECHVYVPYNLYEVTSVDGFESTHNYEPNSFDKWVYSTENNVAGFRITFDKRTMLAGEDDYIYISSDDYDYSYRTDELAGATVDIPGENFQIELGSDNEEEAWGFKVTKIEELQSVVTLDERDLRLYTDANSYRLHTDIRSTNGAILEVEWSSSDPTVATVNEDGYVTPVSEGDAYITAKLQDASGSEAICRVRVRERYHYVDSVDELETDHDYDSNMNEWWIYTASEDCKELKVTFSKDSETEEGYDYLRIYDKNDNLIGKYEGAEFGGQQITVPGNVLKIRFVSDGSVEYYGFKVDSIEEVKDSVVEAPTKPLKFSGASLTLQDNLAINFRAKAELFADGEYTNPYVVFSLNGKEVTVKDYAVVGTDYVFPFTNIAPNQMNDTVVATLYADYKGVEYSSEATGYSVADYCYNMLGKTPGAAYAEFRTLLVDLLNYGEASQIYTNYKTDDLVTADLTDAQKADGTVGNREYKDILNATYATVANPTASWRGAGLNLKDRVEIRLTLAADNIDSLSVKVTSESGKEWTIESDKFVAAGTGKYDVCFNGLNAGEMSEPVYFTVYDGDKAVSNTARYSVESYVYKYQNNADTNLAELVKAMMNYGDAAYNYVH